MNSITIIEPSFMMQLPHKSDNVAIPSGGFESTAELIGSMVSVDNGVEGRCQTASDKMFHPIEVCLFIHSSRRRLVLVFCRSGRRSLL